MLFSLASYFLVMLAIGMYACQQSTDDIAGYILGGRRLSPAVTALSAGASDMSGWMLLGLPGAMYLSGLSSIWIAVGLLFGALLNYIIVAPRLRVYTEVANNSLTIPDFFENRFSDPSRTLRLVSSLVIVVFFTLYTSSGVVAGGKLFESAFHLDYEVGLYITCGVVVLYTLFGGFLAVSLTDFVQGCIMFIALVLVPFVVISDIGGLSVMHETINSLDADKFNMFQGVSALAIISAMAWGLGYFGQPHIIVRFMAIRSVKDIPTARRIGMSWMIVSIIGAMTTGLAGIAYVAKTGLKLDDAETIFILPPSYAELQLRLNARGLDKKEEIKKRLGEAKKEVKNGQHFDHLVVNDEFETALSDLKSIIFANKTLPKERKNFAKVCLEALLED